MKVLRPFFIVTDIGFIAYWIVTGLHFIPPQYLFRDYANPILVAWNWSFLFLDVCVSATGLLSVHLYRQRNPLWRSLALISLVLTFCSGLQAIAFFALNADFDPVWWLPNLYLLVYPLPFIAHFVFSTRLVEAQSSWSPTVTVREKILNAANRVVLEQGSARLTLDAVAHEAGVSKGGLLYHFPSKDALVAGMIEALIEHFNADVARLMTQDAGRGAWLRAYTRATFHPDPKDDRVGAALLAAASTNPDLLAPLETHIAAWQRTAEKSGIDPALATIIRLAVDGLYYNELLNLSRLAPDLREQVMNRLIELSQ